jgi:hypothetical protein
MTFDEFFNNLPGYVETKYAAGVDVVTLGGTGVTALASMAPEAVMYVAIEILFVAAAPSATLQGALAGRVLITQALKSAAAMSLRAGATKQPIADLLSPMWA